MVEKNWKDDRIVLTPINLYMEYILLSYNNFLKEKLDKNWIHNHPNTAFSAMAQKILSL